MSKMKTTTWLLIIAAIAIVVNAPSAVATPVVALDENTGSCNHVTGCTVILSFTPTTGQVDLFDSDLGLILDVITFDSSTNSATFASDDLTATGGCCQFDNPGDTFGPPLPLANVITLDEPVNETFETLSYIPSSGQPGFPVSGGPVSYSLTSDSPTVPEPSCIFLVGTGLLGLVGIARQRLLR